MPSKSRHLMMVTRSGTMIEDPKAFEADEELISDRPESSMSFDDDRMVPYYIHFEEGLPPRLVGYVQIYTGGAKATGDDPWHLLVKAPAIYYEAANGLNQRKNQGREGTKRTGLIILAVGGALAVLLFFASFFGGGEEPEPTRATAPPAPAVEAAPAEAIDPDQLQEMINQSLEDQLAEEGTSP